MDVSTISVLAVAIIVSVSAISTGIGFALLGGKFLESASRQPEITPMLQTKLFILAGLLDAIPIIGVAIAFILLFANPFVG